MTTSIEQINGSGSSHDEDIIQRHQSGLKQNYTQYLFEKINKTNIFYIWLLFYNVEQQCLNWKHKWFNSCTHIHFDYQTERRGFQFTFYSLVMNITLSCISCNYSRINSTVTFWFSDVPMCIQFCLPVWCTMKFFGL